MSIIERAAGRLQTEQGAASPADRLPGAPPPPTPEELDRVVAAAESLANSPLHGGNEHSGNGGHPGAIRDLPPAPPNGDGASAAGSGVQDSALPARSNAKTIEVDFERLRTQGIIFPGVGRSQLTEEFRHIKRNILYRDLGQGTKNENTLMITSCLPAEGKTYTAINLAISIALEQDLTVLLIDADLTRPGLFRRLGFTADVGFVDLLQNPSLDAGDVMYRTNIDSLSVVPAGKQNALSTELLGSNRMDAVVRELSERYSDRIVIFDAPPVLATTEPSVLAMHVAQVVFVVEAERVRHSTIKTALELVSMCPNIGFVLNKLRPQLGQSNFGQYYYQYGDYYAR